MGVDYGIDLDEVRRVIDDAEVLVIRFSVTDRRLLVDTRSNEHAGPMVKVVPPARSAEERFRAIKMLRPRFRVPQRVVTFQWPRHARAMEEAGVIDHLTRRIVATGLRNPFRMAFRPGTSELWIGDVGAASWEEINILSNATDGSIDNFGWPCYEGPNRNSSFDAVDLTICEQLYAEASVASPYHQYAHTQKVVTGETCPQGSSSLAGMTFAPTSGGSYPADFAGAAFFADYSRDCIWVMKADTTGRPSPSRIETFVAGAANPVSLHVGPDGALYYVDFDGGKVWRVRHTGDTTAPQVTAVSPPNSAVDVDPAANVTATFSEPMDASTVNTSTVTLRNGPASGPEVPATVAYDATARVATLDPVDPLPVGTTFTLVITGGAAGVKDAAGVPLAADATSSFTTMTVAGSVRYLSDLPFVGTPVNGWGPIERDRSNGEEGPADGQPLQVGSEMFAKGLGVHAVSEARFAVPSECTRFQAKVGIDEKNGKVVGIHLKN